MYALTDIPQMAVHRRGSPPGGAATNRDGYMTDRQEFARRVEALRAKLDRVEALRAKRNYVADKFQDGPTGDPAAYQRTLDTLSMNLVQLEYAGGS